MALNREHLPGRNVSSAHYRAGRLLPAVILLLFLFPLSSALASAGPSPLINMIEVMGNKKVSTGTVLSRMKSEEGMPFSKDAVQEDIKSLYKFGYFDDIRVEIESFEGGVKLTYIFTEKPTITSIDFQGNDEFETEKLKEHVTLTTGAVANLPLITDNAGKVVQFYHSEGYWLAKVVPIIRDLSEDSAAVTFQIEEGKKVHLDKIVIEGNKAISDDDIIDVMKTKEWWIFSFITNSGIYREDQIRDDLMRIKSLYQSRGYLYIAVSDPEVSLSPDKKDLTVTIYVSEGDQFSVGKLKVEGNTVFSDGEIYEKLKISEGKIFNRTALAEDIDSIIDMYMNRGYARADVNPIVDVNAKEKLADLTLSIQEGDIFKVGRININGNTKTRDKIVRREMRLDEGDIFNKSLIKRSYQRINNLDYFETVDIQPVPNVQERLVDIDVNVKEKLTGMLSLGGGYSSIDKFMVTGEVTQSNLFGRGLYLKFKSDFSSRRTNFNLSLRDPWFMNKPVSASIGVYNEVFDYTDYDKKATGGFVAFGKELSEYVGGSIKYKIEQVEITDISDDASSLIRDQEGSQLTSSITPSIWRDTRDNYLDPSEGSRNTLTLTLAGLGGDTFFYKGMVDSVWYFPVIWDTTFSVRGRYGYASGYSGKDLPLYERFYVGGINTIRGLGFGEGGPRNDEGENIGGVQEALINLEYIFPILKDIKLKGVLFFDYGGSFDDSEGMDFALDNMRQTAGVGLRWLSPFGPVRLEWGFNLDPLDDESGDKLEFSMGGLF